jgi:hypothetical protein
MANGSLGPTTQEICETNANAKAYMQQFKNKNGLS